MWVPSPQWSRYSLPRTQAMAWSAPLGSGGASQWRVRAWSLSVEDLKPSSEDSGGDESQCDQAMTLCRLPTAADYKPQPSQVSQNCFQTKVQGPGLLWLQIIWRITQQPVVTRFLREKLHCIHCWVTDTNFQSVTRIYCRSQSSRLRELGEKIKSWNLHPTSKRRWIGMWSMADCILCDIIYFSIKCFVIFVTLWADPTSSYGTKNRNITLLRPPT